MAEIYDLYIHPLKKLWPPYELLPMFLKRTVVGALMYSKPRALCSLWSPSPGLPGPGPAAQLVDHLLGLGLPEVQDQTWMGSEAKATACGCGLLKLCVCVCACSLLMVCVFVFVLVMLRWGGVCVCVCMCYAAFVFVFV